MKNEVEWVFVISRHRCTMVFSKPKKQMSPEEAKKFLALQGIEVKEDECTVYFRTHTGADADLARALLVEHLSLDRGAEPSAWPDPPAQFLRAAAAQPDVALQLAALVGAGQAVLEVDLAAHRCGILSVVS